MALKLQFLLVTLLFSSYIFAISASRPHRYGTNATLSGNTSKLVSNAPDGIEERGDDVHITTASTFKVYLQRGTLAFDLCPNAECEGENHVCYPTDVVTPGATYNCGNIPSTCGYYVKMSDKKIWFTPENSLSYDKTFGSCLHVVMQSPETVYLEKSAKLSSCTAKVGEHGAVTLHVKKASTSCPLIVKNAKINPPELSSTTSDPHEKSGNTPESSQGMAGWLIAVIVIACFIGAGLIVAVLIFGYCKFFKKSQSQPGTLTNKPNEHQKDQAEVQETNKPNINEPPKLEDAQKKVEVVEQPKLEEVPSKPKVDIAEQPPSKDAPAKEPAKHVVAEVLKKASEVKTAVEATSKVPKVDAPAEIKPKAKDLTVEPAAAPVQIPVVVKPDYDGTRRPPGFCRRMKSKSGRSFNKEDSLREVSRKNYAYLLNTHAKDMSIHVPETYDQADVASMLKKYTRSKNLLDREIKLVLHTPVVKMIDELVAMGKQAQDMLIKTGSRIDENYKLLNITRATRDLVADPSTPEYVKHYMFALEHGPRVPRDIGMLEKFSFSLLFVIAIGPSFSYELRRLAAARIKSDMSVVEEYWAPAERAVCCFPINATYAAEQKKANALIAADRPKKPIAKKVTTEETTKETEDQTTTADKQAK